MNQAALFARRLGTGEQIEEPVALVVAHPDDETLWAGAALPRLADLALIVVTDGAPLDMSDATRLGFTEREAYADTRSRELSEALRRLEAQPALKTYNIPDQQAIERVDEIVGRLAADLERVAAVLTHPYEGGHPDHDAIALAVRIACRTIAARGGRAPALIEFACYHAVDGERRFGQFWPDAEHPEQARELNASDRQRVDHAIAAYLTQVAVVGAWRPQRERWRAAPDYDFTAPPPPQDSLYDGFKWTMTSDGWRERARQVLTACP